MRECVDEGILQAYLDDELSPDEQREVTEHLGACAACAVALDEAGAELSLLTAAFAPDTSINIPTVSLRERLDAAIAAEARAARPEQAGARWNIGAWLATLFAPLALTPPRLAAFASVAAALAFGTIFVGLYGLRTEAPVIVAERAPVVAPVPLPPSVTSAPDTSLRGVETPPVAANPVTMTNETQQSGRIVPASMPAIRRPARAAGDPAGSEATAGASEAGTPLLPGERSYLRAIASLSSELEDNPGMTPALRAEYERSVAVVDQAIYATRAAAQRNPHDPDAGRFLVTAYQNKIELLQTIVDQTRFTAAR